MGKLGFSGVWGGEIRGAGSGVSVSEVFVVVGAPQGGGAKESGL